MMVWYPQFAHLTLVSLSADFHCGVRDEAALAIGESPIPLESRMDDSCDKKRGPAGLGARSPFDVRGNPREHRARQDTVR